MLINPVTSSSLYDMTSLRAMMMMMTWRSAAAAGSYMLPAADWTSLLTSIADQMTTARVTQH